jgi:hypothetical protein
MTIHTPVAFIIFNRPDVTERVFQAIRQAKPKKLLVIADGPRVDLPGETEKCTAARAVIDRVDWTCEVLHNYSDVNLGCGKRPATGIDWIFSQVDEAIILEDDCLPSASFFSFCQNLLETYRYDERVMMISGGNFQAGQSRSDHSYYFSKYAQTWGWATWKRAWNYYDYYMKNWPEFKQSGLLRFVCEDSYEYIYWTEIFDQIHANPEEVMAWDYQWTYKCFSQSGLCIMPNKNLVSNIGFGTDATHTKEKSDSLMELPTSDIWEIEHPHFVVQHKEADSYDFEHTFEGKQTREKSNLISKIKRKFSAMTLIR